MINKSIIYLGFILILITNSSYAQVGPFVDKDKVIAKYENYIVGFLIKEKEISITKCCFKISDYQYQIFIHKCLTLYTNPGKSIILVRFGASASDTNIYWGVFSNSHCFIFLNIGEAEYQKFASIYDNKTVASITAFIKQTEDDSKADILRNHSSPRTFKLEKDPN
jgi:hypothetical protein